MSAATKRKHVTREVTEDLIVPQDGQLIVRVLAGRGNNLHEVEDADGNRFLVSMPTKFRRNIWIKRGQYVMCERIEEGDKVKGEIVHVLYPDNIRHIQSVGCWPFPMPNAAESDNQSNTAKSGGAYSIDKDMLPPSDDSESEEEDEVDEDDESDSQEEVSVHRRNNPRNNHHNPNHNRGIFSRSSTAVTTTINYPTSSSSATVSSTETDSTESTAAARLAGISIHDVRRHGQDTEDDDHSSDDDDAGSTTPTTETTDNASSRQVHLPSPFKSRHVVPFIESKFARTWLRPVLTPSTHSFAAAAAANDEIRSWSDDMIISSGGGDTEQQQQSGSDTEHQQLLPKTTSNKGEKKHENHHQFSSRTAKSDKKGQNSRLRNQTREYNYQHRRQQQQQQQKRGEREDHRSTTSTEELDAHQPVRHNRFSAAGDVLLLPSTIATERYHNDYQQRQLQLKHRRRSDSTDRMSEKRREDSSLTAAESNTESAPPANAAAYDFLRSSGDGVAVRRFSTDSSTSTATTTKSSRNMLESPLPTTSCLRNSSSNYSQQSTNENSGSRKSVHFSPSLDSTQISEMFCQPKEQAQVGTSNNTLREHEPSTSFLKPRSRQKGLKGVDIKAVVKKLEIEYQMADRDDNDQKDGREKMRRNPSPSSNVGRLIKPGPSPSKKPPKVNLFASTNNKAKSGDQGNQKLVNGRPKSSGKNQSVQTTNGAKFYDDEFPFHNRSLNHQSRRDSLGSKTDSYSRRLASKSMERPSFDRNTSSAAHQSLSKTKYYSFTQQPSPKTVPKQGFLLPVPPPHRPSAAHWSNLCHITAKYQTTDSKPRMQFPPPSPNKPADKESKSETIGRKEMAEPIGETPKTRRRISSTLPVSRMGPQNKVQNVWTKPKQKFTKPVATTSSSSANNIQSHGNHRRSVCSSADDQIFVKDGYPSAVSNFGKKNRAETNSSGRAGCNGGKIISDEIRNSHTGFQSSSSSPINHQNRNYSQKFSWENRLRNNNSNSNADISTEDLERSDNISESATAGGVGAVGINYHRFSSNDDNDDDDDDDRTLSVSSGSSSKYHEKLESHQHHYHRLENHHRLGNHQHSPSSKTVTNTRRKDFGGSNINQRRNIVAQTSIVGVNNDDDEALNRYKRINDKTGFKFAPSSANKAGTSKSSLCSAAYDKNGRSTSLFRKESSHGFQRYSSVGRRKNHGEENGRFKESSSAANDVVSFRHGSSNNNSNKDSEDFLMPQKIKSNLLGGLGGGGGGESWTCKVISWKMYGQNCLITI